MALEMDFWAMDLEMDQGVGINAETNGITYAFGGGDRPHGASQAILLWMATPFVLI